ncbi:xanthine dehydrogenase family protein molybdopterin-binding subunit, partial [Burkholderia cenocepacia]|nr:xanthine dehydrogenase family protein molybdopterin-binding subunit [Burkholderia cenocepacia]
VIVVAQTYWQAKKACDAADIVWDAGPTPAFDSTTILAQRKGALQAEHAVVATQIGEPGRHLAESGNVVEADYHTPYIVHATMEP